MATNPYQDLTEGVDPLFSQVAGDAGFGAVDGLPFWGDLPQAWDKVIIAGITLPGLAELDGEISQKLDQRKKPGSNGARLTLLGWEQAKIDITLTLWTPEHLKALEKLATNLRPRSNKGTPSPVDIYHPALALYGIRSVVIYSLGLPRSDGDQGFYKVRLKALEFRTDDATVSTPKSSVVDYGNNEISPQLPTATAASDVPAPSTNNTGPT